MNNVAILLTDHESYNEKILIKSKKFLQKCKLNKIYFIGDLLKFKKIYQILKNNNKFKFIHIKNIEPKKYLHLITNKGIFLLKSKKINIIINLPLNKKKYLKKNFLGYTEFFSKKIKNLGSENMLLFNNIFSVCPITTHIPLKKISYKITKKKIISTIKNINTFYKKIIKKNIKIKILGLNPHAGKDFDYKTEEKKILIPAINYFKKHKKISIDGPLSSDTAFQNFKNSVYIGMYHDQVLIPFKIINKFNGINITIGTKYLRISPDHGIGDFKKKYNVRKINNLSFKKCINFCEKY